MPLRIRKLSKHSDGALYAELSRYCGGEGGKPGPCPMDAEQANGHYEAIKKDLPRLSIEEMRQRHGQLANLPKHVLNGVLAKQGYPAEATKTKALSGLLGNLTSLKVSHDQTSRINDHSERFSEGNNSLDGVEIFAAGEHRGKEYTPRDLDCMVDNFKRFSSGQKPGFRVPLVLGHEEQQDFLDRSDIPAAGWATRIWRDGPTLKADFEDVPDPIARLIKGKRYRTVSSEVYDQPPEGISGQGKMLRRVALLGGDIPQLKDLDDIPTPTAHVETRRFARYERVQLALQSVRPSATRGAFWCFSEMQPMSLSSFGPDAGSKQAKAMWAKMSLSGAKKKDGSYSPRKYKKGTPKGGWGFDEGEGQTPDKESVLNALAEAGGNRELLSKIPDDALGEVCRMMTDTQEGDDGEGDDDQQPQDHDDMPLEDDGNSAPSEYDEADPRDGLAEHALDNLPSPGSSEDAAKMAEFASKYAARVRRHAERARKYLEKYCSMSQHGEGDGEGSPQQPVASDNSQPKKTTVTHQYSEQRMVALIRQELKHALEGDVKASIQQLQKFREEQLQTARRASSEEIADQFVKEGRLPPAERDDFVESLYEADDTKVRKFSEGGKTVQLTARDRLIRTVKNRNSLFSERFKDPANTAGSAAEGETIVAEHFDRFSEDYRKNGYTREQFVKEFNELNDANKALMLQEYSKSLSAA